MYLPAGYFFGISAATGGLTDNHDVKSFVANRVEAIGDQQQGN